MQLVISIPEASTKSEGQIVESGSPSRGSRRMPDIRLMLREKITPGDLNSLVIGTLTVLQEIRRSGFDRRGLFLWNMPSEKEGRAEKSRTEMADYTAILKAQNPFPIVSVADIFTEKVNAGVSMKEKASAMCVIINTASFTDVFVPPKLQRFWGGIDYVNLAQHTMNVTVIDIGFSVSYPSRLISAANGT
jgi:hypothetical protein